MNPVEGDVVLLNKEQDGDADTGGVDESSGDGEVEDDRDDADEDAQRNAANSSTNNGSELPTWQQPTKILTSADLESKSETGEAQWRIDDVVLPLPGSDIPVPEGWMSDLYAQILAEDGLTHDDLTSSKHSDYHLKGSYRRIIARPASFSYEITSYTDPDVALTKTDEEISAGATPSATAKTFLALTLKFQLPSSSYATMLMREALKSDTSSFRHRQMTQQSEDQLYKGSSAATQQQQ
ncbi:pseudouridine synthase [Testicularia cyperi]|uniref:Pseudouridine synthase n=1 Tax=Testicularia cyperi TaxID=1882483 RepID=A0A317XJP6_9BASI|nr:pseudouridine synthase [Testicularia cyperi]